MADFKFGDFKKPFFKVLLEAIVVGILLVILCLIAFVILNHINNQLLMTNTHYIIIGVMGAIFHILCEYSGINLWYSKNYCELI